MAPPQPSSHALGPRSEYDLETLACLPTERRDRIHLVSRRCRHQRSRARIRRRRTARPRQSSSDAPSCEDADVTLRIRRALRVSPPTPHVRGPPASLPSALEHAPPRDRSPTTSRALARSSTEPGAPDHRTHRATAVPPRPKPAWRAFALQHDDRAMSGPRCCRNVPPDEPPPRWESTDANEARTEVWTRRQERRGSSGNSLSPPRSAALLRTWTAQRPGVATRTPGDLTPTQVATERSKSSGLRHRRRAVSPPLDMP